MAYFPKFSASSEILKPVGSLLGKSMNMLNCGVASSCLCQRPTANRDRALNGTKVAEARIVKTNGFESL